MAACATQPAAPLTEVKTIGLVSALGDELEVIGVGTTVFQNKEAAIDVSNWEVDEMVLTHLAEKLGERYRIVDVDYDEDAIISEQQKKAKAFFGSTVGLNDMFRDQIQLTDKVLEAEVDAYVVIVPSPQNWYGLRGNPTFFGPGIYSSSFLGSRNTFMYLGAAMVVVDAKSFAEKRFSALLPAYKNTGEGHSHFARGLDNELLSADSDQVSEEDQDALKAEFITLMKDSINWTLEQVGLTFDSSSSIKESSSKQGD